MKPANRAYAQQNNLFSWLNHPLATHSQRAIPPTLIALLTLSIGFSLTAQAGERLETPVSVNVTESGAATASIQIEVPPGTAGMTPALSLNYNSQGGNGLMGMGWSLAGLSAIYRCGKTMIQDGTPSIIVPDGYTLNDKYCLDGQPLVAVNGTYGADGTEYRTEREAFIKIISYGVSGVTAGYSGVIPAYPAGTGPAYFKAWTKSGQIITFGTVAGGIPGTPDASIEAVYPPTGSKVIDVPFSSKVDIRVWAVSNIADTAGNYLTVTYQEDAKASVTGDYRPWRIDYTGNINTGTAPYSSVRFVYSARTDITPLYNGGVTNRYGYTVTKVMQRLTNIQTYTMVNGANVMVKDYRIAYQPNLVGSTFPQQSQVESIGEFDGNGNPISAPITVGWQSLISWPLLYPGTLGSQMYLTAPAIPANTSAPVYNTTDDNYEKVADFNGDGKADYVYVPQGGNILMIAYANSSGTGFEAPVPAIPTTNLAGMLTTPISATPKPWGDFKMQWGDFNGDGRLDYMWQPSNGDGRWLIAYANSSGNGFSAPNYAQPAIPATITNGGATSNFVSYHANGQYNQIGDFNGDGKDDFMWIPGNGDGRWLVAYTNVIGNGFTVPDYSNIAVPTSSKSTSTVNSSTSDAVYPAVKVGDFDGDGKMDLMYFVESATTYLISGSFSWSFSYPQNVVYANTNGLGFTAPVVSNLGGGSIPYTITLQIYDLNGDGKADYVSSFTNGVNSAGTTFGFSTGRGFGPRQNFPLSPAPFNFGDFNGDGKLDFMYVPYGPNLQNLNYWNVGYSTGSSSYFATTPNVIAANPAAPVFNTSAQYMQIGDFNGDGKMDYMYVPNGLSGNSQYWNIAYSTGAGFTTPVTIIPASTTNIANTASQKMKFADFNGDGKMDYMYIPNGQSYWNLAYSQPIPKLVYSITSGLGTTTTLTYKPLTDPSVYIKDSGTNAAVYPYIDIIAPMYIVSTATVSDGVGGTHSTNYKYYGAKAHRKGGGFLGFRQFDTTDMATNIKTSSVFRQDYPFQGLPISTIHTQSNGMKLKEVTNTWGVNTFIDTVVPLAPATYAITNGSKHQFSYVKQSVEKAYELTNGTTPVTTVQTDNVYDTYGNATSVTVSTLTPAGALDGYNKVTTNTYWNDPNKWLIGRLVKAVVTSTSLNAPSTAVVGSGAGGTGTYTTPAGGVSSLMSIINSLLLD